MQRFLIALFLVLGLMGITQKSEAQYIKQISGYLNPGVTRTFYSRDTINTAADTIYQISGRYSVSGTLYIQEGAEVWFLPDSRIVDSTGGKIIANGFAGLARRIKFRGINVNSNSDEWGHMVALPGADSVYFANCQFSFFRKKERVDRTLHYGTDAVANHLINSLAIIKASNGVGAVLTTFSQKTWLYDIIADSCQAIYRGGAFAFLQAPSASYFPGDDGRLALQRGQVHRLLIRDCRVFNEDVARGSDIWDDNSTRGGAIYMSAREGATTANFIAGVMGNLDSTGMNLPTQFSARTDTMQFERCVAENTYNGPLSNATYNTARGGAIYVGDYTGLTLQLATFNTDSAKTNLTKDFNQDEAWGGAIAVSKFSADPNSNFTPAAPSNPGSRLPGLAIKKRARFLGNVAGLGGAIHMDYQANGNVNTNGPMLNIDGDNIIQISPSVKRDSGLIDFTRNTAYQYGGAIYQNWYTYITGYLAPITHQQPRWDSVELRVRFIENAAGIGGGSVYLNPNANPDYQIRRARHLSNFVNPRDSRINRPSFALQYPKGGGAEYVGTRDSTFAVEYFRNYVIGGNGGAVFMNSGSTGPNTFAYNRFFAEDQYVATSPILSPLPFDRRELTRFIENWATLGDATADSVTLELINAVGCGRGGGLFVDINNNTNYPFTVKDSIILSRVRFEKNQAFSGSAIHSDNYFLHLQANQTLVANNFATSRHSANVDFDPVAKARGDMSNPGEQTVGATIWADFEGADPSHETNSRGNAIYDNRARYILRLPNGEPGVGGIDTVRGNFWGETGPDIITKLPTQPIGALQSTFFIDFYDSCYTNVYEPRRAGSYSYTPMPIGNPVPDTLLMEGRIYDIFDAGKDIKTLDYNDRRLAIQEAFSLGIPNDLGLASNGRKGLHRFTRDIFSKDPVYLNKILSFQTEFSGPHPIGYPLFLQADVDLLDFNRDPYARNYSVVFVLNKNTQEYVRVNLKEIAADDASGTTTAFYRGRIDFVPDSTVASRHPSQRARVFWSPSLIRPTNNSYAEIQRAAMLEDSAALRGRFYKMTSAQLKNTTAADSVCTSSINDTNQWYAGELYHTLPVRPGDNILVFSRTQLWKYGFAGASSRGLSFTIGDVLPPFFVGDIDSLSTSLTSPGRKFVREDVQYKPFSLNPADPILIRIAGYDVNNFYNPAWLFDAFNHTMLDIAVKFQEDDSLNYRLPWWLQRDTVFNGNIGVGSNGYVQLYGTPHNSDVVPGGEPVSVVLTNFPPNFRSEHELLNNFDSVLGADSNGLSQWIFPPYFNCPQGFQRDTLCVRSSSRRFDFRIFVMDSLPLFTSTPSTACAANLTDSLRYDYDVNTDDEREDDSTLAVTTAATWSEPDTNNPGQFITHNRAWDFRYGRTSYALKISPQWLKKYFASHPTDKNNFNTHGIFNIRYDAASVYPLITPTPQVNGELLLDTIVAVEADDGHAGKTTQQWRLPINIEPTITTTDADLPHAKEDFEWSTFFNGTNVPRIKFTDPNFGDSHTFHLIYKGQTEIVYRDGKYKTGADTVVGRTPAWVQINPVSGVLYGTPGLNDAPHITGGPCGDTDFVTVVIEDVCQLTDWKNLHLEVDSTNHPPKFVRGPRTICVRNKTPFCDTVWVTDRDLKRLCPEETLTLRLNEPAGFTVTPGTIKGPLGKDTSFVVVCGQFNEDDQYFVNEPLAPRYIGLTVTDASGDSDVIRYQVHIGDIPTFECAIYVSNKLSSSHAVDVQRLCFGAGRFGHDSLDIRYCELEVPPPGPNSVFDGRWELPIGGSLKGTHVDIRRDTNQYADVTWQVRFQSGSESGSFLYPVEICWNTSCFDSTGTFVGSFYIQHPNTPSEFSLNMKTGGGPINNSFYTLRRAGSDSLCLEIRNVGLDNVRIVFAPAKSDVPTSNAALTGLEQNSPNPFGSNTTLRFNVAERTNVKIEIYDIKGALVRTLVNEVVDKGSYPVTWDATSNSGVVMSSGTYIAKMIVGDQVSSIKMTLNK